MMRATKELLMRIFNGKAKGVFNEGSFSEHLEEFVDSFRDEYVDGSLLFNRLEFKINKKKRIKVLLYLNNLQVAELNHDYTHIGNEDTITFVLEKGIMQIKIS